MSKHAKLSPSSSKRWQMCPGSIRLSEGIPNTSSVFADEGSAAHALADHCMALGFDADRFAGMYVNLDAKQPNDKFAPEPARNRSFEIDDEMVDSVQQYLDLCRGIASGTDVEWEVEQWLSLEHLGVEGLDGGTGDFVAYTPASMTLDVCDFKYGRGVAVDPKENSQALCYALGAVRKYHNRGIKKLRLTIVQPRCGGDPVRTWEADVVDLLDFETDLIEAAKKTVEAASNYQEIGVTDSQEAWEHAYLNPGPHCKFCPAAPTCPARRDAALAIAQAEFSAVGEMELPVVTSLPPEQLAKILAEIDQIDDWSRRVKEYAHAEATHGRCPPGFKLVAKRATRRWKDEDDARRALAFNYSIADADMLTEPELKTPAQIEPLLPGKNKAARANMLSDLVSKESSGTVLAPEHDPRPAVRADASEFGEVTA